MNKIMYGSQEIEFTQQVNPRLKHTYIAVDFLEGVVLKGPVLDEEAAQKLVLSKAAWIVKKLQLVSREAPTDIVTGSRLLYLGRHYYTHVVSDPVLKSVRVRFDHSSFKIHVPLQQLGQQAAIEAGLTEFYRQKAEEKIRPRLLHWMAVTRLEPRSVKFRKLNKKWGSCSPSGELLFNIEAVKLPFSLIDYLIVHELCHLRHPNHSKAYRHELAKYLPQFHQLDDRLTQMKC